MTEQNLTLLRDTFPLTFGKARIECGDGWFHVLFGAGIQLEPLFKAVNATLPPDEAIQSSQIKEKWGLLRWYTDGFNEDIYNVIAERERLSAYVCEDCGNKGALHLQRGWMRTLCPECATTLGASKCNTHPFLTDAVTQKQLDELEAKGATDEDSNNN